MAVAVFLWQPRPRRGNGWRPSRAPRKGVAGKVSQ
jgi:hypothetical protein